MKKETGMSILKIVVGIIGGGICIAAANEYGKVFGTGIAELIISHNAKKKELNMFEE